MDEHSLSETRQGKAVGGYEPSRTTTRYEAAATLFLVLSELEAAAAQPRRSPNELKPGRKSNLVPNPKKAKNYTDIPATHWARKSVAGLNARGIALLTTAMFYGEKAITGDEFAGWLGGLVGWVEGRPGSARSVSDLVDAGYIPQTSPLVKKHATAITAKETSQALVQVVVRAQEKITTVSPDSRFGNKK
jgi:S-layer homology domain